MTCIISVAFTLPTIGLSGLIVSLPNYFAAEVAAVYDEDAEMFAAQMVDPVVDYLAALVGEGAALEFGVGTGRIALPWLKRCCGYWHRPLAAYVGATGGQAWL